MRISLSHALLVIGQSQPHSSTSLAIVIRPCCRYERALTIPQQTGARWRLAITILAIGCSQANALLPGHPGHLRVTLQLRPRRRLDYICDDRPRHQTTATSSDLRSPESHPRSAAIICCATSRTAARVQWTEWTSIIVPSTRCRPTSIVHT